MSSVVIIIGLLRHTGEHNGTDNGGHPRFKG